MTSLQRRLLCSVALPVCVGFGAAAIVAVEVGGGPTAQAQSANPCSPCGASPAGATDCYVPRLREAQTNPCAAEKPCAANPCAAGNACNPCAANNPCAAENPCAAAKPGSSCAADHPCAAKNPCASAEGGNPCATANPCAAENPCAAANPCNPCNPCGAAAQAPDVTPDELRAVYDCLQDYMRSAFGGQDAGKGLAGAAAPMLRFVAYSDSGLDESASFLDWKNFATAPYTSATHGDRFVVNHANGAAEEAYGKYEEIGTMPQGGIVAKPSFTVTPNGEAQLGPLFLMEKMASGWNPDSGDWRYTMVMSDGTVSGRTQGPNAEAVEFCVGCHAAVAEAQDSLFFIPEAFRVK